MTLLVPAPGMNEYRKFFNHRDEEQTDQDNNPVMVSVADFVSVVADHEPAQEEWEQVLLAEGYTSEDITLILEDA